MIYYIGTQSYIIKQGQLMNIKCSNCDTNSSSDYHVYGKYMHIFLFPLFPIEKKYIVECNNCYRTLEFGNFSDQILKKLKIEKERNPAKYPIWFYTSIIITGTFIGFLFYSFLKQKLQMSN